MDENDFFPGLLLDHETFDSSLEFLNKRAEDIFTTRDINHFPPELDLRDQMLPVRSQGNRPTCVAFTAAAIKEYQERKDCDFKKYLSPEFVYHYRSNVPERGMYSRDFIEILKTRGICPEFQLPYDGNRIGEIDRIPIQVERLAKDFIIKDVARIHTSDGLKVSLYHNGPCYISFPYYGKHAEFWKPVNDNNTKGNIGHVVTAVGYNTDGFILRNSWGSNWNGNGHTILRYEDFSLHVKCITLMDMRGSHLPPEPEELNERCACNFI
jgi:C1A family cysteine protease